MLLCVLCAFVSFLTTTLCVVTVATAYAVPNVLSNVCYVAVQLLDWTVHVAKFLAELSIFLFGIMIDIANFVIQMYSSIAPHIVRAVDMAPHMWRDSLNALNGVRVNCWDFISQQIHAVLGLWALLLATLWSFTGRQRTPLATGNTGTDHTREDIRRDENLGLRNEEVLYPRRREARPVTQRLYPDLDDIDHTFYDRNDSIPSTVTNEASFSNGPDQGNSDLSLCIVCLDRARGVAVFPCGHTHMCLACTRDVMRARGRCPVCQTDIEEYRTVFL